MWKSFRGQTPWWNFAFPTTTCYLWQESSRGHAGSLSSADYDWVVHSFLGDNRENFYGNNLTKIQSARLWRVSATPLPLPLYTSQSAVSVGGLGWSCRRRRGKTFLREVSSEGEECHQTIQCNQSTCKLKRDPGLVGGKTNKKRKKKCYWRIKAQQTVAVYLYCCIVRRVCQRMLVGFRSQFLFENFVNDNLYLHSSPIDYAS